MQIGSFKISTSMVILILGMGGCICCCSAALVLGAIQSGSNSPAAQTSTALAQAPLSPPSTPIASLLTATPQLFVIPTLSPSGPTAQGTTAPPTAVPATPDTRPALVSSDVFKTWNGMTAIQRPDYERSLTGRRIEGTGKVFEVYETGYVRVFPDGGGIAQSIDLYDLPRTLLTGLKKDQAVRFVGRVRRFTNLLGQTIEVENTQIAQ